MRLAVALLLALGSSRVVVGRGLQQDAPRRDVTGGEKGPSPRRPSTLGELLAAHHQRLEEVDAAASPHQMSEAYKAGLLHEPFCPTVYVYDAPELWDYPVPFAELHHLNPAALVGTPCGDGTFDTDQYTMAMLVLYRLAVSTRCRVTTDPTQAELFLVPAFPTPKNHDALHSLCEHETPIERHLPHLTADTAHRHVMLLSKGHINLHDCDWWRQPQGLLAGATRVSYSVVVRGEWDPPGGVARRKDGASIYGPFDGPEWPLDRLAAARDYDDSGAVYPHAFSVPYPSDVHWDVDAGPGPWARVDRPRRYLASFIGAMHGEYGIAVRRRIAQVCKAAGEPACHYADLRKLPHDRTVAVEGAAVRLPKGHCHFGEYKQDAVFCLEPGGDSPYRKSLSDDIAMGCIPVVFSPYMELVDPWHWDHFRNDSHVYINREDFLQGRLNLFEVLQRLVDSGEARRKQHAIARHGHAFQYSLRDYPGDAVERLLVGAAREAERRAPASRPNAAHVAGGEQPLR
eukprot:jgi/Tetstr1/432250/TSEL_002285.t1